MRPILHEHQLQAAQKFKPQQLTHSSAIFKAAFDQYLIVACLDESDVLAPVDAGLVGGWAEDARRADVIVNFGECVFDDFWTDAVHFLVKDLQLASELCQV